MGNDYTKKMAADQEAAALNRLRETPMKSAITASADFALPESNQLLGSGTDACSRMSCQSLIEERIAEHRRAIDRLVALLHILPPGLARISPIADQALFDLLLQQSQRQPVL